MRNPLMTAICTIAFAVSLNHSAFSNQDQEMSDDVMMPPPSSRLPVARNGEVIDSVGGGATEAVISGVQSSNGISYLTGGVGDEELEALKSQEGNYNTRLLMSSRNGEYMGNVSLSIFDSAGNQVLKADNTGPYFYTNLPNGTYTVEATSMMGATKTGKLVAGKSGKTVLVFDE